jgi:oligoendopeptidase F
MVTHLLEAAYQREVYRKVDNGESLTAPVLNNIMRGKCKSIIPYNNVVDASMLIQFHLLIQQHRQRIVHKRCMA